MHFHTYGLLHISEFDLVYHLRTKDRLSSQLSTTTEIPNYYLPFDLYSTVTILFDSNRLSNLYFAVTVRSDYYLLFGLCSATVVLFGSNRLSYPHSTTV